MKLYILSYFSRRDGRGCLNGEAIRYPPFCTALANAISMSPGLALPGNQPPAKRPIRIEIAAGDTF